MTTVPLTKQGVRDLNTAGRRPMPPKDTCPPHTWSVYQEWHSDELGTDWLEDVERCVRCRKRRGYREW